MNQEGFSIVTASTSEIPAKICGCKGHFGVERDPIDSWTKWTYKTYKLSKMSPIIVPKVIFIPIAYFAGDKLKAINLKARGLNFSNWDQVGEPLLFSGRLQKDLLFNLCFLRQATQRDPEVENNRQISLRPNTLFQERRSLKPRSPADFSEQTCDHFTFDFFVDSGSPDQRNLLHNLFIILMQHFRRTKAAHQ